MTNKITFILLTMTILLPASGGGVTVGNGQGRTIVGLSLKNDFFSEDELTFYADGLIKEIQMGRSQKINRLIKRGKCDPRHSQVKVFNVQEFYPIKNGVLVNQKEYVGYLQVELKKCKMTDGLTGDAPFGGRELWDL